MRPIGAVLVHPPRSADRVRVRAQSRLAGRCEGTFWRRTDRREVRRVVLGARRYELATRAPGRRQGALGHVALEVLDLLANLVSYREGRLEPAIVYLMRKLRRSRDAITRALAALRRHGFADWLRRYESVERDGPGPRVRQVTNAYRLHLPPRAARLLGTAGQDAPVPDDVAQILEDRRQAVTAFKGALPLHDLAVLEVENGTLGRLLGQLGRLVEERESASRTESRSKAFL